MTGKGDTPRDAPVPPVLAALLERSSRTVARRVPRGARGGGAPAPEQRCTLERAPEFEGYRAAVDWPACAFWRELAEAFPDAKVVLTTRDAESWYESYHATIRGGMPTERPADDGSVDAMMQSVVVDRSFGGRLDRAALVEAYRRR